MEEQRVFVTVGTTSFEELIRSVTEKRFLKVSKTVPMVNGPLTVFACRGIYILSLMRMIRARGRAN